ncbi:T4 beta protein [Pseudonocardia sediminis]|uniref:T4 beta protein n=1 Tax=Pseudonocardia sediminis TaxID=1397368 RepID=A0A4Q7UWT5_PSEST|nr:beta family protein [Pseudonocardia sediminis]RZT85554.1 T4 beta protein [Pseudonocardia sediminis]
MTLYFPIMKGRPGELQAWTTSGEHVHANTRPLFEIVPGDDQKNDLAKFFGYVAEDWPADRILTVDAGALEQGPVGESSMSPTTWLATYFHDVGVPVRPVVHLSESDAVIDDAASTHQLHGNGICVRAGSRDRDADVAQCSSAIPEIMQRTGLDASSVDLIFDFSAIADTRDVQRTAPGAQALVTWAAEQPWRAVAVTSAAFPESISALPKGEKSVIRRFDVDLWLKSAQGQPDLAFGDYGIGHPSMPMTQGRSSLPNLRYTVGEDWWVWREAQDLPGYESMRTLCKRIVESGGFAGRDYSWGDAEIDRVARGVGGTGNATHWRAWATSHHLAAVIDRLANRNAP